MKELHHEDYPSQSEMQEWLEANREIYSDFKGKIQSVLKNPLCNNHSELIDDEMATPQSIILELMTTEHTARISQAILTATKKKDNTIRLLQGALEASWKILNVIADILYQASEVFRRAINAIIHFGTEQHKSLFAPSEAADIKSVMQEYGKTTEIQKAVGDWLCGYAEHKQVRVSFLRGKDTTLLRKPT